jgi:DNA-binding CsgD family transcriptional regulator
MRSELVGRRPQRERLEALLARARHGQGSIVLVSGEAGMGKTRLAEELATSAGLPVLRGTASQGRTAPFAPVVAALRTFLHTHPGGLDSCGPLRPHLARLLPELGPPAADHDRATLFEALRCAFGHVGPGLVVLDDLQWSDEATLELLAALAEPLTRLPLLVLATYRSDGLPRLHGVRRLRNDLRRAGRLEEITLDELDEGETAQLLASVLPAPPAPSLARAVHDRTAGVPFFVEELAGALDVMGALRPGARGLELSAEADVPIPDTVRDAVLIRVAELSEAGRRAAELAAVAGDGFDLPVAAELVGEDGLGELLETGMVSEDAGTGRFRHALTREALYADLPWTTRRRLHAQLAEALERTGAASRDVASQWLGARADERAREALLRAARESEAVHAYRDAAEAGRQALELWPDGSGTTERVAALERYARCSQLSGDLSEAARAWRELIVAADGDERIGGAQRALAAVHDLRGDGNAAVAAREAAAASFAAAGRLADAVSERIAVATHYEYAARNREAMELAGAAREDARRAGRLDLQLRAAALEGMVRARLDDYDGGLQALRAALALALEHDLTPVAAEIYQHLSATLLLSADYPRAEQALDTAMELCRLDPDPAGFAACMPCLAYVLYERGEWSRAADICREMIAAGNTVFVAEGMLGAIYEAEGRLSSARRLSTSALAGAKQFGHYDMTVFATATLARLAAAEGNEPEASARCRELLARWEESEDRHYAVSGLRWSVTFSVSRGNRVDAHTYAGALARIASPSGHRDALAALAQAIGECALLEGDTTSAVEQLVRAVELHAALDMPFERAQIELRAGVALAAADQRELALDRLGSAYRTARKLGARPLAAAAATEVRKLGASAVTSLGARARADGDGVGLSRREREILGFVAGGRTNREIAGDLVLSPRTVDMHVRNILRKLDCRSRVEAAVRAGELGLAR